MNNGLSASQETAPALIEDASTLLQELVRIDSVNPGLVPGAAGEAAIASFTASWLESRRFEITRLESARAGRRSLP